MSPGTLAPGTACPPAGRCSPAPWYHPMNGGISQTASFVKISTIAATSLASNAATNRSSSSRLSDSSGSATSSTDTVASCNWARARCSALFTDAVVMSSISADLGGRPLQHVAQDQHGPLPRRQELHRGDHGEPDALPAGHHRGRVAGDQRVRHRLEPRHLALLDRARRRRPSSVRRGRSAAVAGCATPGRSGRRSSRSCAARCASTSGPRTGRTSATPARTSPAPDPRRRRPSRASGSSGRAAPAGTGRPSARTRCPPRPPSRIPYR